MAFTFLLALGHAVGRSLVEAERVETARAALDAARRRGVRLILPLDTIAAESVDSASGLAVGIPGIPPGHMGLAIGPPTCESLAPRSHGAEAIACNHPHAGII